MKTTIETRIAYVIEKTAQPGVSWNPPRFWVNDNYPHGIWKSFKNTMFFDNRSDARYYAKRRRFDDEPCRVRRIRVTRELL